MENFRELGEVNKKPNFGAARKYVFNRLQKELAPNLFYHGIYHTKDYVLPASEKLAKKERVKGEDLLLLRTAALYHDVGYLQQYFKNEPIAVRIASETLPNFGYSKDQIERIGKIIMATQLKLIDGKLIQAPDPRDILQKLMCDADLDSLGREDFFVTSENLRRELREYGMPKTLRKWYEEQLIFLETHSYFTNAAKLIRDRGKQENIQQIKILLGKQEVEEILRWVTGKYENEMIEVVHVKFRPRFKERLFCSVLNEREKYSPKKFGFDFEWELYSQQPMEVKIRLMEEIDKYLEKKAKHYTRTPELVKDGIRTAKICLDVTGFKEKEYPVITGGIDGLDYDMAREYLEGYKTLLERIQKFRGFKEVNERARLYQWKINDLKELLKNVCDERT
jgi:uncharacterized protein